MFFALDALGFFLCVGVMFVYCAATVNYLIFILTIICEDQESASLSNWLRLLGFASNVRNCIQYWELGLTD